MRKEVLFFLCGSVAGGMGVWFFLKPAKQDGATASALATQLAAKSTELERAKSELKKRDSESAVLSQRLQTVIASLQSSDPDAEREIGDWISRVNVVRRYLDAHPELQIPEMSYLQMSDWLDATKEKEFRTEMDLRLALAWARQCAKVKAGPAVAGILAKATANGSALPPDLSSLTSDERMKRILARYSVFDPSHPPPGYWAKGANTIVVESSNPEPGIDLPQWFTREGGFGISGTSDEPVRFMKAAIDAFTSRTGSPPRTLDDVRPLFRDDARVPMREEILKAPLTPAPHE